MKTYPVLNQCVLKLHYRRIRIPKSHRF